VRRNVPAETALQSFGAVQIDDEMMAVRTDAAGLLRQRRHLVPVRNPPAQPERVVRGELSAVHQFEQQNVDVLLLQRRLVAVRVQGCSLRDRMMRPALSVRELVRRMQLGPHLWNRRVVEERPQQELDLPVPEEPQHHRRGVLAPAPGAWLAPHVSQELGESKRERLAQLDGRPPIAPLERLRLRIAPGVIDEQGVAQRARPLVKGEQRAHELAVQVLARGQVGEDLAQGLLCRQGVVPRQKTPKIVGRGHVGQRTRFFAAGGGQESKHGVVAELDLCARHHA
jgi:hypothetical protein